MPVEVTPLCEQLLLPLPQSITWSFLRIGPFLFGELGIRNLFLKHFAVGAPRKEILEMRLNSSELLPLAEDLGKSP